MDINTKTSNHETLNTPPKPAHHLIPSSCTTNKHHAPPSPHTYKECLKNHAASIGGHAVDGCGEYMPSSTDPTSLKCAVCDCHRNFHRQEPSEEHYTTTTPHFLSFHHHLPPPHVLLKLSSKAVAQEEHRHQVVVTPMTPTVEMNVSTRKRFRTKFSGEQKEKMQAFSEKLGWRMSKNDDLIVEEFCKEIGVNKSVLKVWMHNNKTKKESNALTNNNGDQDNNNVNFSQHHQ